MKFNGVIIDGLKVASTKTIKLQFQYFEQYHIEFYSRIKSCFMGTINIEIFNKKEMFEMFKWDFQFNQVAWMSRSSDWKEDLYFKKIKLNIHHYKISAWLYQASRSPHIKTNVIEIIAPYISNLSKGSKCYLEL